MRMRVGLRLDVVFEPAPEGRCAHVLASGQRCGAELDAGGHHAAACGRGGAFHRRHNGVVHALASELRRMGFNVRREVWLPELMETLPGGGVREARMDLVIDGPHGQYLLDITCFHPFSGKGKRRTHGAGGTLEAQEAMKRARYPVRDAARRRRTLASFHPIVVSTFGDVGPAAQLLFRSFEATAIESREAFSRHKHGWLTNLVSYAAAIGSATAIAAAYTAPDGQMRAHYRGAAHS